MAVTYFSLYTQGVEKLLSADIEAAETEAEWLLLDTMHLKKAHFLARMEEPVPKKKAEAYRFRIQERLTGKPLAYILGTAPFRKHTYSVKPGVLIPRPETEGVVEAALELIKANKWDQGPLTILEFGFGSGIISIELALELPKAKIYAWDKGKIPYQVATQNADILSVTNVQWFCGDFFNDRSLWESLLASGTPVLLVGNPPYIPDEDIETLDDSVKDFEPMMALRGGHDGTHLYKKILKAFLPFQIPMIFEIGIHQVEPLSSFLTKKHPGGSFHFIPDISGIPRVWVINPGGVR